MKITKAIPARLQKEYLSDAERDELRRFQGRQATPEEIAAFQADWQENTVRKERETKRRAILKELDDIDTKSIRAIRANETDRLAALEARARELREELKTIT